MRPLTAIAAAIPLLAATACTGGDLSPGLSTVPPDRIAGVEYRAVSVEHDGAKVAYRYPAVPNAPALTREVRTVMAEAETEFMTARNAKDADDGPAELRQDAAFLAAAPDVLGVRVRTEHKGGPDPATTWTTRWYDAESGDVLPWTALLNGEDAVGALRAEVARVLRDDAGIAEEKLPKEFRSIKEHAAAPGAASPSPAEVDPRKAKKTAKKNAGSALADLGFDATGGLVVSLPPGSVSAEAAEQARGALLDGESRDGRRKGGALRVPIGGDAGAPLLSAFGERAAKAARKGAGGDGDEGSGKGEPVRVAAGGAKGAPPSSIDCGRVPCVALTFDDGPGDHTGKLLDSLDSYSAKATFYLLGQAVKGNEDVVRRMTRTGHETANHSWKHDDLAGKSGGAVADDMKRTDRVIEKAGGEPVRSMRPPYGSFNDTTAANVGHPVVLWDVDTLDWKHRSTKKTIRAAVDKSEPGSVVLFHDIHRPTVDAFPETLRKLHARGFHFVTVTELFDGELTDGKSYSRRK
ncbi:peptidoglycan/xylan/chitin deacetylase (PgdA/CDA1 family) [Murinocardiopsis flavida]|uniref:Peptidoglycan/xylan/chitin deacetylase (PgdA/CDA1 family) n=2 Tax=Murinocardiopsis flavida TaxID=645275 RepID=A0A2P8CVJ8_9ACTN|nr:peptidoglycan/xylan/chitin deacetylase (PgdA/CDA1 family) [Murinocardiopsis flavida]